MPIYKLALQMMRNGTLLPEGALVNFEAGPERDALVESGAIYRPDIGPRLTRLWGGLVFLPARIRNYPQPGGPGCEWSGGIAGYVRSSIPGLASIPGDPQGDVNKPFFLEPVDEWSIPDQHWPNLPPGHVWASYDNRLRPARFRPIY